jgi:type I restriction enzyme S subunit
LSAKRRESSRPYIGDIPHHWKDVRLKQVLRAPVTDGPHETPEFVDVGRPFLSVDAIQDGKLIFEGCRHISEEAFLEYRRKAAPEVGDLLMGKAASTGKIARVTESVLFSIWSPLALIKLDSHLVDSRFIEYTLKTPALQQQVDDLCNANTQKNIGMGDIPKLAFALPPISEQERIANFLDDKTARIDALIAEKERLADRLFEYRQSVATNAVTLGIPGEHKAITSHTFLGAIPKAWRTGKFRHYVQFRSGQVDPEAEEFSSMVLIAPNHIESSTGRLLDTETALAQAAESGKYWCDSGDVIYSKIRPALRKAAIAPFDCLCSADMYPLKGTGGLSNKFLFWYLLSEPFSDFAVQESMRVAMPKLNRETLANAVVPLPPPEEQAQIVTYIELAVASCDALSRHAEEHIARLREYRSSLISAAVTGQIDIGKYEVAAC